MPAPYRMTTHQNAVGTVQRPSHCLSSACAPRLFRTIGSRTHQPVHGALQRFNAAGRPRRTVRVAAQHGTSVGLRIVCAVPLQSSRGPRCPHQRPCSLHRAKSYTTLCQAAAAGEPDSSTGTPGNRSAKWCCKELCCLAWSIPVIESAGLQMGVRRPVMGGWGADPLCSRLGCPAECKLQPNAEGGALKYAFICQQSGCDVQ